MPEVRIVPLVRALMIMLTALPLANLDGGDGERRIDSNAACEPCRGITLRTVSVRPPHPRAPG